MTKEEAMQKLEIYYRKLGLENFLEGKEKRTFHNLLAASVIVEGFFNGQKKGEVGEKIDGRLKKNALVYLLKYPMLNVDGKFPDSRIPIVNEIDGEKIPKEMATKIYKIIIYLSANLSYTAGKIRITYPALLSPKTVPNILKKIREIIEQGKDMPVSEVLNALYVEPDKKKDRPNIKKKKNTITESEQRGVIRYFEEIGLLDFIKVDSQLIYSYENLEQARQIVEKYFGEKITKEVKRAVLMCILGSPLLRNNNTRKTCNLADLVDKLHMIGLGQNEIFAIIINYGINGKMLAYSYGEVLSAEDSFISHVEVNKNNKRLTRVDPKTLEMAVSKSQEKKEEAGICEYYKKIGLSSLIFNADGKLYYSESELNKARQIAEGYFRGLATDEVIKVVLRSLLSHDALKEKVEVIFDKLATVIDRMRENGLDDRDIYGILINLSFTRRKKDYGYSFNQILRQSEKVDNMLQGEYNTEVTAETLTAMMRSAKGRNVYAGDFKLVALSTPMQAAKLLDAEKRVEEEIRMLTQAIRNPDGISTNGKGE